MRRLCRVSSDNARCTVSQGIFISLLKYASYCAQGRRQAAEQKALREPAKNLEQVASQLLAGPKAAVHSCQQTFENAQHNWSLLGESLLVRLTNKFLCSHCTRSWTCRQLPTGFLLRRAFASAVKTCSAAASVRQRRTLCKGHSKSPVRRQSIRRQSIRYSVPMQSKAPQPMQKLLGNASLGEAGSPTTRFTTSAVLKAPPRTMSQVPPAEQLLLGTPVCSPGI